jgi:uncharacterized membrane-anchored protein YhcB (DUF1043 family)
MIRMFKELKEDLQKQLNELRKLCITKLEKTQKQLNELKEDTSKHWKETKEVIKKR